MLAVANRFRTLIATSILAAFTIAPAPAQMAETWNIQAHSQAESANSRGITLLSKRQMDKAVGEFRHATQLDPSDPVPFQSLGLALAMQGEYKEALDALQKSYSLRPNGETLLSTGIVYYLMHDYDAAINTWNKLLESNPKLCHVNGSIGFAFLRKGEFPQAEQYFGRLVQCHPNSEFGYYGLALSRLLRGDYSEARSAADRAEMIQSYPPVVLLLAKLDALQGDMSRAQRRAQQYNMISHKAFVQRSMTELGYPAPHDFHWDPFLADNYDNGYLLMARLQEPKHIYRQRALSRQGKAAIAAATIKQELNSADNDFYLLRQLGLAQLADGDYSSAAEALQSSLVLCPNCNTDLLWLGLALARDGKYAAGSAKVREFEQRLPRVEIAPLFKTVGSVDPSLIEQKQPAEPPAEPTETHAPAPRKTPRHAGSKHAPAGIQEGKPVPAAEF